jgi:hypothetical protein
LLLHIDKCRMTIARSTSGIFFFWIEPSIAPMRSGRRGVLTIANVPVLEKYEVVVVEAKRGPFVTGGDLQSAIHNLQSAIETGA